MIDRNILKYGFSEASFPNLFCSRCQKGTLVARNEVKGYHPAFSQIIQREEWSWWDDVELRLSVTLRCANSNCGEEHIAYARGGIEPGYDHNGNTDYEEYFKIHFIVPSPHIIDLPKNLPDAIRREFLASFDNYWAHKNLAANSIRNALEELLSHFGIEDEKNGKWVSLGNRLKILAEIEEGHAEFLTTLKPIVNAGSHGNEIKVDTLLDAYEALEIFLDEIFSERKERFQKLVEKLSSQNK